MTPLSLQERGAGGGGAPGRAAGPRSLQERGETAVVVLGREVGSRALDRLLRRPLDAAVLRGCVPDRQYGGGDGGQNEETPDVGPHSVPASRSCASAALQVALDAVWPASQPATH